MDKDELTDLQKEAIDVVQNNNIVYQSELSDMIDCSSGYVSKMVKKLVENDFIKRQKDDSGKYILKPTKKDLDFSLLMAGDEISPFIGEDDIDIKGDKFSNWLMNLTREEEF